SRCGSPRTPVRRSSSMSGRTLAKCAPAPSNAPAATSQPYTGWPGSPAVMNAGSSPNEIAYGSTDSTVALSQRLYDQAEATAIRCRLPANQPDSSDSGTTATAPATPRPTAAASAADTAVTAAVGSGWQARTSARTVPTAPTVETPVS